MERCKPAFSNSVSNFLSYGMRLQCSHNPVDEVEKYVCYNIARLLPRLYQRFNYNDTPFIVGIFSFQHFFFISTV